MKKLLFTALAATVLVAPAFAQDDIANMPAPGQPLHAKGEHHEGFRHWRPDMSKLTPEQREAMKARMEKRHERMENMTPGQKAKMKEHMQQRKAKWEKMTPEQRAHAKERMHERREKWQAMTPEQREAAKAKFKEHRAERMQHKQAPAAE